MRKEDGKRIYEMWCQLNWVLILMIYVVDTTATAVCWVKCGCGPGQTASVWPLWHWMCRLLSGQRSLLCLGWSHLLQILPCWSLHQEVTARTLPDETNFSSPLMCVCTISALHTFNSTLLFHHSILPWMSQCPEAGLSMHYHRHWETWEPGVI